MCEYCKEPHGKFITDGLFDQCRIEHIVEFGKENEHSCLCVNNSAWAKINYCPMCGRELK